MVPTTDDFPEMTYLNSLATAYVNRLLLLAAAAANSSLYLYILGAMDASLRLLLCPPPPTPLATTQLPPASTG